jgi:hypothetical protein
MTPNPLLFTIVLDHVVLSKSRGPLVGYLISEPAEVEVQSDVSKA